LAAWAAQALLLGSLSLQRQAQQQASMHAVLLHTAVAGTAHTAVVGKLLGQD
jgi:hypothetical protein